MNSSNPALRHDAFQIDESSRVVAGSDSMTLIGTVIKTGILLVLCIAAAAFTARLVFGGAAIPTGGMTGLAIGTLVLSLVIGFVPRTAPFLAPVYAIAKGALLGVISWFYAVSFGHGGELLVAQAFALTFGIFLAMLLCYATGLIRGGALFRSVIITAMIGISLTYLANFICSMLGFTFMAPLFGAGWIGIGFSLLVVGVASFSLILDFQIVSNGIDNGAPKYMEWYAGFAMLVTLIWIYMEVLRLLSKLRSK
jgi:uncharacterized YccA/Bax inhibitor family protein